MEFLKMISVFLTFVLITVFVVVIVYNANSWDRHSWKIITYKVRNNDTLWKLSDTFCPKNVEKREWIARVQSRNNVVTSILYIGQELELYIENNE